MCFGINCRKIWRKPFITYCSTSRCWKLFPNGNVFIFDINEEVNSDQDNFQEVPEYALNLSVSQSGLTFQIKSINSMGSYIFMVTTSIIHIKKNTLNKLLKCLRLLRTTLVMLTHFQMKKQLQNTNMTRLYSESVMQLKFWWTESRIKR